MTKGKKTNKVYTKEERKEVVKYRLFGATLREVKEKYGVLDGTLTRWENELYSEIFKEMEKEKRKRPKDEESLKFIHTGSGSGYWK